MGKLRNAETDIAAFVQWIGRKCRNHDPLAELSKTKSQRNKMRSTYETHTVASVGILPQGDRSQLIYKHGNRCFHIEVREVDASEFEGVALESIGH